MVESGPAANGTDPIAMLSTDRAGRLSRGANRVNYKNVGDLPGGPAAPPLAVPHRKRSGKIDQLPSFDLGTQTIRYSDTDRVGRNPISEIVAMEEQRLVLVSANVDIAHRDYLLALETLGIRYEFNDGYAKRL